MSNINQAYFDRVRYILQNSHIGSVIVTEPIGWKGDDKEYDRSDKHHGIFVKLSNNLKFIDEGYDTLKFIYEIGGINEDVRLIKEERHPKTDVWTRTYDGYLDMSTYKDDEDKNQISVKFNSGGIEAILKSRENENVEITRETTLDGKPLVPLNIKQVELEGREIFLKTTYEIKPTENAVVMYNQTNGQTRGSDYPIPLSLVNKSHEEAQSPIVGTRVGDDEWDRSANGETGLMFFAVSDVDRTIRLRFNLRFRVRIVNFDDINFFAFWVNLVKYKNSSNYNYKEKYILLSTDNYNSIDNDNYNVSFDQTITLLAGESLALCCSQNMDGRNGHSAHLDITVDNIDSDYFEITEESFYEKSISNVVLPHEVADRLIEIYTGQKALYSDALGRTDIGYQTDGKASLNGIMHGFWIRGFNANDEVFKPLTTSLNEFMDSFSATWNLGLGIEKIGYKERVRIEELSYFYNRNTTIKLPNKVKKVKRSISSKHFFSSVNVGYEKGGNYEEAFGLDEYNGKSFFATIFTRFKSVFSAVSKYRADTYGLEFCRRKPKSRYSTQDTRYDTDKFLVDLKRGIGSVFNIRKWQDDFETAPTGTFSPSTAYNLRLSPFNCLMRHGWEISAGLTKNLTDYLRYTSSTANSSLKTKLIGKPEYAENGDIINSELPRARYISEIVEFEHEVDFDISQALQGTTVILGKEIPNMYGCIEYTLKNGDTEKGFLLNLKPNKEGKWKVLKVNR